MSFIECGWRILLCVFRSRYKTSVEEEDKLTKEQAAIKNVGKQDPKRHLEERVSVLMATNIVQCLGAMVNTVVFA